MPDRYREIYDGFRWDVPADFNIGAACCGRWAKDRHRFALYWEDEGGAASAWTFWDLQQQANRLSNALAALGVGRGDRVAVILPQRPETAIAHVALYQMGAVAMPLSILFGPEALEYRLANSEASAALVDPASAGYRIGPSEIENCLVKHPAVANAAVVPSPDEERGNVVKAYIVLGSGIQPSAQLEEDIRQHVRARLAPYEYPKEVEFIDALPMTTTGKVQRRVLRLREQERKKPSAGAR